MDSNFNDTELSIENRRLILTTVTNIDVKCSTKLHDIGTNLVILGNNVTSLQNKLTVIDKDKKLNQNEKIKQKSTSITNFLNNPDVYNNIKSIVDKIIILNFNELKCATGITDTKYVCSGDVKDIDLKSDNAALIQYKSLIKNILKWIVGILDQRQAYCGYNSDNSSVRDLYVNLLNTLNPYSDYYFYLYSGIGLGVGIFIGMLLMYFILKK
jgi:hypothetical protein